MKDLENVSLLDIMPDSITDDAKVNAAARSIDPQLRAVAKQVDAPSIYEGFDKLTGKKLDHLAVQYDITVWRDDWPDNVKRNVLKTAIHDKSRKGSVASVKNAVASLGSAVSIREWWQTGETPHTFKIYVAQTEVSGHVADDVQSDIIALVEDAKPARSHYDFIIQQPIKGGLNMCGFIRAAAYNRVSSSGKVQEDVPGGVGIAALARAQVVRRLVGESSLEA